MKVLEKPESKLTKEQFAVFLNMYIESLEFLMKDIEGTQTLMRDKEIIMEALDILALFTP